MKVYSPERQTGKEPTWTKGITNLVLLSMWWGVWAFVLYKLLVT